MVLRLIIVIVNSTNVDASKYQTICNPSVEWMNEWMKGLFILSRSTFINDKKWCNEGKSALNGKKSFKDNTDNTVLNDWLYCMYVMVDNDMVTCYKSNVCQVHFMWHTR